MFTAREEITREVAEVFNLLTAGSAESFRELLVGPTTLMSGMLTLIDREIEHAAAGRPAGIVAKMNGLTSQEVIRALYRASMAGVEADLIVRGICCLRPGIPGVSDRIRVFSLIGRYLEHSRIFHFANGGNQEIWAGSADWDEPQSAQPRGGRVPDPGGYAQGTSVAGPAALPLGIV